VSEATATAVPPDPAAPVREDGGTPRWWTVIHLLAALLTAVDAVSGSVPLTSLRIGPDGSTSAMLTGYATAAFLYALAWRRAACGSRAALGWIALAFAIATLASLLSLAASLGLEGDGWTDQMPLESSAAAVVQDLIVLAALVLLVRGRRDLPARRVPERAIRAMTIGVVTVALVTGAVATAVAWRTATPAQAAARTAPLLDAGSLADVAERVRDRATWRPWEHWSIVQSGYLIDGGAGGSGSGPGTSGLPAPTGRQVSSWLVVSVDEREVCLTQVGPGPVRRGGPDDCGPAS
jgi:hypothetical protein